MKKRYILTIFLLFLIWLAIALPSYKEARIINRFKTTTYNMNRIRIMILEYKNKTGDYPKNDRSFGGIESLWNELINVGITDKTIEDIYSSDKSFRYFNFIEKYGNPIELKGNVEYKNRLNKIDFLIVSCGPDGKLDFDPNKELKLYESFPNDIDINNIKGDIYYSSEGKLDRYFGVYP